MKHAVRKIIPEASHPYGSSPVKVLVAAELAGPGRVYWVADGYLACPAKGEAFEGLFRWLSAALLEIRERPALEASAFLADWA